MKKKDFLIKILIAIISIILVIVVGINLFIFNFIYGQHTPNDNDYDYSSAEYEWFSTKRELISIQSFDEFKLYGNLYENNEKTNKWAIIVHGYTSEGKRMAHIGKAYYEKGYNVLIIEQRGHGISESKNTTFGYKEKFDLINWINYINENYENTEILLHGVSMGAATILQTIEMKELPNNIELVISDCSYSSLEKQFTSMLKNINISNEFLLWNINTTTKIKLGFSIYDVSPMESVKNSNIPILFIHGEQDNYVPFEMVYENFENANCEKELLTIKDASHANCSKTNEILYWNTIWSFIEKYN